MLKLQTVLQVHTQLHLSTMAVTGLSTNTSEFCVSEMNKDSIISNLRNAGVTYIKTYKKVGIT